MVMAGCGVDPSQDDRPRTLHYITEAILVPSCANAQCHSGFREAGERAYDTVRNACITMIEQGDVVAGEEGSRLYEVLIRPIDRMPYDQPLPKPEIELIRRWIVDENAAGLPATVEECP